MLRRSSILVKRRSASGLTLVELLVVLAIIATLAGIVYPAIISSIQKSEAAMAAQRIDAVEKAKVQYERGRSWDRKSSERLLSRRLSSLFDPTWATH